MTIAVASNYQDNLRVVEKTGGRFASTLRISFLSALFVMRDGIPAAFAGLPIAYTNYFVAIAVTFAFLKWLATDATSKKIPYSVYLPILFFIYCVAVAAVSSTFIFHYDPDEWAIGQYLVIPILTPVLLYTLGYSISEITKSILIAATGASMLIIVDQAYHLPQLEVFYRRSVADGDDFRRIVILKNEIAWATLYFLIRPFYGKKWIDLNPTSIALLAVNSYVLFNVLESRLAIASILVGFSAFMLFGNMKFSMRTFLFYAGIVCAAIVLPIALQKYITAFTETQDYFQSGNINIRIREYDYFWDYFLQTYGLGFGVLSAGPTFSNFISWATWYAVPGYDGFGVQDLGIVGVLVQFGVVGLIWVLAIHLSCMRRFLTAGRDLNNANRLPAIVSFCYMLGFLLSPLPMNFFTFGWTVFFGWTLWFMSFAVSAGSDRSSTGMQK